MATIVSAGFDACEHELQGMQRHGGKVPVRLRLHHALSSSCKHAELTLLVCTKSLDQVSFYARFARDTSAFARTHAQGRVVSVLEGGYGDRALSSAAMASLVGMSGLDSLQGEREGWWSVPNLIKVIVELGGPSWAVI